MIVSFVPQRNLLITIDKMMITLDTAVTDKTTVNLSSLCKVSLCAVSLMSEAAVICVIKEVPTALDTDVSIKEDDNKVIVVVSVKEATRKCFEAMSSNNQSSTL